MSDDDFSSERDHASADRTCREESSEARNAHDEEPADESAKALSDMLARATALPPGSVGAVDALLSDVIASGLPTFTFKKIAQTIAKATGADTEEVKKRLTVARVAADAAAVAQAPQNGGGAFATDPDPDPAPCPIDLLLDEFAAIIERRVTCSPETRDAAAVWALATWGVRPPGDPDSGGPDIFPLLHVGAPAKRCGKTTMLETIRALVRRPIEAADISAAALFRVIDARRPTLLVDEFDRLIRRVPDIASLINSAHTRSGAVIRTVETVVNGRKVFEPTAFATYTPIALAGIGRAPGTIADRSVRAWLQRQPVGARSARVTMRALDDVRQKLAPHCVAHSDAIGKAMALGVPDATIPASLNDRDADGWRPLLGLACLAGGSWPGRGTRAAIALCKDSEGDAGSPEWRLSQIVEGIESQRRDVVTAYREWRDKGRPTKHFLAAERNNTHVARNASGRPLRLRFASSNALADWLWDKDDSGFGDARSIQSVKARVARELALHSIKPQQVRVGRMKYRGYGVIAVRLAWNRYKP